MIDKKKKNTGINGTGRWSIEPPPDLTMQDSRIEHALCLSPSVRLSRAVWASGGSSLAALPAVQSGAKTWHWADNYSTGSRTGAAVNTEDLLFHTGEGKRGLLQLTCCSRSWWHSYTSGLVPHSFPCVAVITLCVNCDFKCFNQVHIYLLVLEHWLNAEVQTVNVNEWINCNCTHTVTAYICLYTVYILYIYRLHIVRKAFHVSISIDCYALVFFTSSP